MHGCSEHMCRYCFDEWKDVEAHEERCGKRPKGNISLRQLQAAASFLNDVREECKRAIKKHGHFNSPHEGYGVLLEEMDELWDEVKRKRSQHDFAAMRGECVQIAAMALNFVISCCGTGKEKKT